ncbi:unnamed protein product [Prorocentrum cordatum]|uniref:Uncharacterized protein n=1 Tax=Prorocentrum cordatum TaxID=2364126 RepID=A0ABN9T9U8_9DINO|nr:unnamed protein product [Polarella glacialis]
MGGDTDDSGKKGNKGKFGKGCGKMGWGDMMSLMWMMGPWGGCGKGWGGWDGGWDDAEGGGAGGRRGKKEGCPGVFKVTVDPTSQLVAQSFPQEAPGIAHDKEFDGLFKQAGHVLTDLVGSVQEFCTIVHDPDWEQFPEVAKALQEGGGPKECLAVATCPNASKWAVGIAAGWKNRESSSKLALAVALAKDDPSILAQLRRAYPMFYSLCMTVQPTGYDGTWNATAGLGPSAPSAPSVHWLTLSQDSGLAKEGFPPEAPCIVHGGKSDRDMFSNAHNVLCELLEDPSAVEYVDDPDWNVMPEVGEALKAAAADCEDVPLTVAKSQLFAAWGVGVGSGWKYRETAAKLALGLSICGSTGKLEEFTQKYPEFYALCDKAGLVDAGLVQHPSKLLRTPTRLPGSPRRWL